MTKLNKVKNCYKETCKLERVSKGVAFLYALGVRITDKLEDIEHYFSLLQRIPVRGLSPQGYSNIKHLEKYSSPWNTKSIFQQLDENRALKEIKLISSSMSTNDILETLSKISDNFENASSELKHSVENTLRVAFVKKALREMPKDKKVTVIETYCSKSFKEKCNNVLNGISEYACTILSGVLMGNLAITSTVPLDGIFLEKLFLSPETKIIYL